MTETFYITAILAGLYLAVCLVGRVKQYKSAGSGSAGEPAGGGMPAGWLKLAAGLGLVLGVAVLLRQLFLLFIPFLFLWVLWAGLKHDRIGAPGRGRQLILPLAVSAAILVGMILPVTAYNYQRFHRFVLLNTNAGYAFFWGNHPIYGTRFLPILPRSMGTYQDLIPAELRGLDEAALDQALLKRGVQFVVDDPIRYALLSLSRVPAYFMFWPSGDSGLVSNIARVSSFGLLWPFMLFGLLLVLFNASRAVKGFSTSWVLLLYLFLAIYTGIHLLTWSLIRYRLPVDAVLLLFAGVAVVDLAERVPVLRRWMRLSIQ